MSVSGFIFYFLFLAPIFDNGCGIHSESDENSDSEGYTSSSIWVDPDFRDKVDIVPLSAGFAPTLPNLAESEEEIKTESFSKSAERVALIRASSLEARSKPTAAITVKPRKILSAIPPPTLSNSLSPHALKSVRSEPIMSAEVFDCKHSHLIPVALNKIGTSESPLHIPSGALTPHIVSPFSIKDPAASTEPESALEELNTSTFSDSKPEVVADNLNKSPIRIEKCHKEIVSVDRESDIKINTLALRKAFLSVFVSLLRGYRDFIRIPKTVESNSDFGIDSPFSPLKKISLRKSARPDPSDESVAVQVSKIETSNNEEDRKVSEPEEDFSLFDSANFVLNVDPVYEVFFNLFFMIMKHFVKSFVSTQMFHAFIEERLCLQEPDWFDVCVLEKMKRVSLNLRHFAVRKLSGTLWKEGRTLHNWNRRFIC